MADLSDAFRTHLCLMNSFTDPTLGKYKNRGWYQKSVDLLAESLKVVSKHVQIDSLNEVLVSPALSTHKQRTIIQALCSQSREDAFDVSVMMVDGMSNRHTKLPQFIDQPKFVNDALRLTYSLTTVQVATMNGPNSFANYDYPSLQTVFSHNSSYVLSLILSGLSKIEAIPSVFVLVLDSAANNKSNVLLGGLGVILSKIYIIYPSTGHTHLSVDGHFGNLSQSIRGVNLYDPDDFITFLDSSPTVAGVDRTPTVFDFAPIQEKMMKIGNLSSNSQYCLSKGQKGEISWSVAPSLHSSILYGAEKDDIALPLFQEDFQPSLFSAKIQKPNVEAINKKIDQLIHHTGNLLTKDQRDHYRKAAITYGKQSFRQVISDLNQKRRKTIAFDSLFDDNGEDPHITVLNYLEKHGYPTGRIPKPP
ncbi:hypothetical protein CAEBREN_13805 [Caenorhabditis brenneri]|uniref:DUF7869 domain-containing protein n=1 Tax=Caenorhabditis brenneri TaxID=135651 RepID=G0N517_CAEBE|nr:hypothetical protein CAEBREN_13805 [Caenorhabditis brenneri]